MHPSFEDYERKSWQWNVLCAVWLVKWLAGIDWFDALEHVLKHDLYEIHKNSSEEIREQVSSELRHIGEVTQEPTASEREFVIDTLKYLHLEIAMRADLEGRLYMFKYTMLYACDPDDSLRNIIETAETFGGLFLIPQEVVIRTCSEYKEEYGE